MKQPQKLGCLCIGVLLFAAQSLSAQETPERAWLLSLLGSLGAAKLSSDEPNPQFTSSYRQAFSLGAQLERRLTNRWGVSVGAIRSLRGTNSTAIAERRPFPEVEIRTLYSELQLLTHYQLAATRSVSIDALAGPVLSWSGAGDVFLRSTGQQVGVVDLNPTEASLLVGAQARFTWRVPLFVRLQYQAGLTDASVGESARSQAFSGVVGLTIFRW